MCLLCGDRTRKNCGPILTSLNCHLLCLKFSSGILDSAQPPRDVEVAREVRRVQKLKCVFCQEPGAFVGCNIKQCSLTYHLHCGQSRGCLNQYEMFSSYCPSHRPKNILPPPPNPTPSCHLCSGLISNNQDLVVCGQCKTSLHIQCCQEIVSQGLKSSSSCPNCGESERFTKELSFYGVWFRNLPAEKVFMRAASGPPSYIISSLSREVNQGKETMSGDQTNSKMSPLALLARQSSASTTPELSPIKDILEFVSDSGGRSREADSDSSRASSCDRDSSPAYRRKVSKLPGRSPKKLVLKKSSKPRPRHKDTSASATGSEEDPGTSTAMLCDSEKESVKTSDSSSGTVQPARKKVKLVFTDTSDGFLSDIDDILKGDVTDPESHPMREAIFSQNNKHLDEIMVRLSEKDDVVDEKPKSEKDSKKSGNKKKIEEVSKSRKKKITVKKPSPRKALLQKKTSKKFAEVKSQEVEETCQPKKKKKTTRRVRLLPLAERQIFHGRNWIPMTEAREAESECNSDWMLKFSDLRITDIADINQAEGRMMKLWNLHMKEYHGNGVKNMDSIVLEFVSDQKAMIVQYNLYRNFVAHLTNLHKAGVLSSKTILSSMNIIQTDMKSAGTSMSDLTKSWTAQRVIEDYSASSVKCSTSTPVRSIPRCSDSASPSSQCSTPVRSFGRSPSSQSPSMSASKPSPLSRGMRIMNLSLSSQKSRLSSTSPQTPLLTPTISEPEKQPGSEPQDYSVLTKKPRLSDVSSNSSPGSLLLHLSDSSFSSHSSGIVKDESTLVEDNIGQ